MARSLGLSKTHEVRGETLADPAPARRQVLLIGCDGTQIRAAIEQVLAKTTTDWTLDVAESFLEAVLVSGSRHDDSGAAGPVVFPLILAGISQEIDQIEAAVRSLRKVNPHSMIVLLCEPGDEVLCRRAKTWGADDYAIFPVGQRELSHTLECAAKMWHERTEAPSAEPVASEPESHISETPAAQAPAKNNRVRNASLAESGERGVQTPHPSSGISPAEAVRQVVDVTITEPSPPHAPVLAPQSSRNGTLLEMQIPQLPLIVQTVLMNDLLAGRLDFQDRAVATLQGYVKWGGKLRFIPARLGESLVAASAAAVEHRTPANDPMHLQAIVEQQQTVYGELHLDLRSPNPGTQALLDQAAGWLGSMLAASRRYEQLRSLAITDELSGAYNRRYFIKFVSGLLDRARVNRFRVSLLLFDIDDFKRYNDTFGHAAGDAIIRELAKLIRSCTRPHDLVARIGGDEFAVIFWDNEAPRQPNSEHPRDALAATARFRKAVEAHQWSQTCNIQGQISISGGLATFPWDADTLEALMAKADEALLRAKAAGKNAILLHGDDKTPPAEEAKAEEGKSEPAAE